MNYFLDTEFNQSGSNVELISIGLIAQDGREYYAQNSDADLSKSPEFVREHVIPLLDNTSWRNIRVIRRELEEFTQGDLGPIFWTWYGNYDWVAVCGTIFGDMTNTPPTFPYNTFDLSQYAYHLGVKIPIPKPKEDGHHALVDARWNKEAWEWLRQQDRRR